MKEKSIHIRCNKKFKSDIELIRKRRQELGINEISYNKITYLIVRHKGWTKIKKDIINYLGYEDE